MGTLTTLRFWYSMVTDGCTTPASCKNCARRCVKLPSPAPTTVPARFALLCLRE